MEDNWSNFEDALQDFAMSRGYDEETASDIAEDYAEMFENLYERYDNGDLTKEELADEWYELYEDLYDEYGLDIGDEDFYSEK